MAGGIPQEPGAEGTALIVRLLRARRGWTQRELARHSRISSKLISAFEQAKVVPTDPQLERLAACVGMPLSFVEGIARVALDLDQDTPERVGALDSSNAKFLDFNPANSWKPRGWRTALVEDAARRAASAMVVAFSDLGSDRGDNPAADHECDRKEARVIWARLAPHSQEMRLLLADILPAARGSAAWALADLVCEKAIEALETDIQESGELAQLALKVVEGASFPSSIRASIQNFLVRRRGGDLVQARHLLNEVAPNAPGN